MKSIFLVLLLATLVFADSCGGNCPSGKCPTCNCGTTKSVQDINTWCAKYSWNQACCRCVVSHESGGNAHALNYNTNGSTDVGLWQINTVDKGLFRLTGVNAVADMPPVTQLRISTALSRFTDGEETPLNSGALMLAVDADSNNKLSLTIKDIIY